MKNLSKVQRAGLIQTLKNRFSQNMHRHKTIEWEQVLTRLEANSAKLWSLFEMERTGGEPDVVAIDNKTDLVLFFDCSSESPKGRRSICYDQQGLESRKEHKPKGNAVDMAAQMGIEILTEDQYRQLQELEAFDEKTSSWVQTPVAIRNLGGALFCDRRYGQVFLYHNGAQSYYAVRGFRGLLKF